MKQNAKANNFTTLVSGEGHLATHVSCTQQTQLLNKQLDTPRQSITRRFQFKAALPRIQSLLNCLVCKTAMRAPCHVVLPLCSKVLLAHAQTHTDAQTYSLSHSCLSLSVSSIPLSFMSSFPPIPSASHISPSPSQKHTQRQISSFHLCVCVSVCLSLWMVLASNGIGQIMLQPLL